MKFRNNIPMMVVGLILVGALSYELALWFVGGTKSPGQKVYDLKTEITEEVFTTSSDELLEVDTPVQKKEPERIYAGTKMVYQYYYLEDKKMITEVGEPSEEMLNLTREELSELLKDYEIFTFSRDTVTLRQSIDATHENGYYFVREFNGKITVFYNYTLEYAEAKEENLSSDELSPEEEQMFFEEFIRGKEDKFIREILDFPIELLSTEELLRLQEGIKVYGDEELMRILENYSS